MVAPACMNDHKELFRIITKYQTLPDKKKKQTQLFMTGAAEWLNDKIKNFHIGKIEDGKATPLEVLKRFKILPSHKIHQSLSKQLKL